MKTLENHAGRLHQQQQNQNKQESSSIRDHDHRHHKHILQSFFQKYASLNHLQIHYHMPSSSKNAYSSNI